MIKDIHSDFYDHTSKESTSLLSAQHQYIDGRLKLGGLSIDWIKTAVQKSNYSDKADIEKISQIFLASEIRLTDQQKSALGMSLVGRFFYCFTRTLYAAVCKQFVADSVRAILFSYLTKTESRMARQVSELPTELKSKAKFEEIDSPFLPPNVIEQKVKEVMTEIATRKEQNEDINVVRAAVLAKLEGHVKEELQRQNVPLEIFQFVFNKETDRMQDAVLTQKEWVLLHVFVNKYRLIRDKFIALKGKSKNLDNLEVQAGNFANSIIQKAAKKYEDGANLDALIDRSIEESFNEARQALDKVRGPLIEKVKSAIGDGDTAIVLGDYEKRYRDKLQTVTLEADPLNKIHHILCLQEGIQLLIECLNDYQQMLNCLVDASEQLKSDHITYLSVLQDIVVFILEYPVDSFENQLQITRFQLDKTDRSEALNWTSRVHKLQSKLANDSGRSVQLIEAVIQEGCQDVAKMSGEISAVENIYSCSLINPEDCIKKAFEAKRKILSFLYRPTDYEEKKKLLIQHQKQMIARLQGIGVDDLNTKISSMALTCQTLYLNKSADPYNNNKVIEKGQRLGRLLGETAGTSTLIVPVNAPSLSKKLTELSWEEISPHLTLPSYWSSVEESNRLFDPRPLTDQIVALIPKIYVDPKKSERLKSLLLVIVEIKLPSRSNSNAVVLPPDPNPVQPKHVPFHVDVDSNWRLLLMDLPHMVRLWNHPQSPKLEELLGRTQFIKFGKISVPLAIILGYWGRFSVKQEDSVKDAENLMDEIFKWFRDGFNNAERRKKVLPLLRFAYQYLNFPGVSSVLATSSLLLKWFIDPILYKFVEFDQLEQQKREKWVQKTQEQLETLKNRLRELQGKKNFTYTLKELWAQYFEASSEPVDKGLIGAINLLLSIQETESQIKLHEKYIQNTPIKILPFGTIIAEILRALIQNHGYKWLIDCVKDARPLILALTEALHVVEGVSIDHPDSAKPKKPGIVSATEQEDILKKYLLFRKSIAEVFKEQMQCAKKNPFEATLLEALRRHLGSFRLDPQTPNYSGQFYDQIFVPFIEEILTLPNYFPRVERVVSNEQVGNSSSGIIVVA